MMNLMMPFGAFLFDCWRQSRKPKSVGNKEFSSDMQQKADGRAVFDGFYGIEYPCDWNGGIKKSGIISGGLLRKGTTTGSVVNKTIEWEVTEVISQSILMVMRIVF